MTPFSSEELPYLSIGIAKVGIFFNPANFFMKILHFYDFYLFISSQESVLS